MSPADVERRLARAAILPTAIAGTVTALVAAASILLASTRARAATDLLDDDSLTVGMKAFALACLVALAIAMIMRPWRDRPDDEDEAVGDGSLLGREDRP